MGLIRTELAPFPGRKEAVWRFLVATALVIVISMTLEVPSLPLSLIMVFFTAQENTVLTRLSGIVLVIGATIAVVIGLLLVKFTINYPMLRILAACVVAFCGMYFMRISKLGAVGFLVAQLVFYFQSFVDLGLPPESLVRTLLWVWVAMTYPILLTITVNFVFWPRRPARLLNDEMRRQLQAVLDQLDARRTRSPIRPIGTDAVAKGVLVLHRHLAFATQGDEAYHRDRARHLARIAAIDRLHTAAAHLSRLPMAALSPAQEADVAALRAHCQALRDAIAAHTALPRLANVVGTRPVDSPLDSVLREMEHALHAIGEAEALPAAPSRQKEGLLSGDAFQNPAYGRFALKTVLGAMLCYVFYTAVQWQGIHTSMLTCFILALPSLGASSHKGLTRIVGCALGSVVALVAAVFIIPHLDSIAGLLVLTLPIVAVGAWIAAGSPRTNYIGVQFVFAYALSQLGHFAPTTDLTEIRDRMIGILVGAVVSIAVSTWIWPEREGDALKRMLARLLRSVAGVARAGSDKLDTDARGAAVDKARLQGWSLLMQNREMQARVALEPGWHYDHDSVTPAITRSLAQAQEALLAVNWLQIVLAHAGPALPRTLAHSLEAFRAHAASRLEWMAGRFDGQGALRPVHTATDTDPLRALDSFTMDTGPDADWLHDVVCAARVLDERISQLDRHLATPAA
jgi:multidrug resistance protein MdtO